MKHSINEELGEEIAKILKPNYFISYEIEQGIVTISLKVKCKKISKSALKEIFEICNYSDIEIEIKGYDETSFELSLYKFLERNREELIIEELLELIKKTFENLIKRQPK